MKLEKHGSSLRNASSKKGAFLPWLARQMRDRFDVKVRKQKVPTCFRDQRTTFQRHVEKMKQKSGALKRQASALSSTTCSERPAIIKQDCFPPSFSSSSSPRPTLANDDALWKEREREKKLSLTANRYEKSRKYPSVGLSKKDLGFVFLQ